MKRIYLFFSRYKVLHILYWIYTTFEYWHNQRITRSGSVFDIPDIINAMGCKMICVYVIIYYLLPKYFYKRKFGWFTAGMVFTLLFTTILTVAVSWGYIKLISPEKVLNWFNSSLHFLTSLVSHIQASILFLIVILIEYYIKKEQESQIIERKRIESELSFLKAQLNPHFLFNALNSIYFLIDGNRKRSKEVLIKFSDLLRYQLYDCSMEKTNLNAEISFLKDYVDLEKIRNDENIQVEFCQTGNFEPYIISPLLLIPFVENAFKFVSREPNGSGFIKINITETDMGWLEFTVENSFSSRKEKPVGGLGIANVKRRLELLYPNKNELQIWEKGNVHKVKLLIKLK
ncbi:MAG TPA: sensor histidine kinase [Moheibacter sp.]|nr:sensor histidine kinase [Moheibacter sp.]